MRRGILASTIIGLLIVPGGSPLPLVEPFLIYFQASGHFDVGVPEAGIDTLPTGDGPVNHRRFAFLADDCHRELRMLLLYEPANKTVDAGVASVEVPYQFELRLSNETTGNPLANGGLLWSAPGTQTHLLEGPGGVAADLFLRRGLDVNYTLSAAGWRDPGAECLWQGLLFVNEIEQNPPGTDAGNEWLEIYNGGFNEVDLTGWTLATHHGQLETYAFPTGTLLPSLSYLVVPFASQFLDNEGESVSILAPRGWEVDRTPVFNDAANDGRSWQRVPNAEESWAFQTSTSGGSNG